MNRRRYFAAVGSAAVGSLAGCLSTFGGGNGSNGDGYPTEEFGGQDVPLAPIDDVYEWYEDEDARFVDARSQTEYVQAHIEGAVLSTAPDGMGEDDPVAEWDADTRIVTYCACPHHLSGQRAGTLLAEGYEAVYVIDEGFGEWVDREYPIAGTAASNSLPAYLVEGRSDPSYVDESVEVREPKTGQREVTRVADDGTYGMTLHFYDVDAETVLELEAPDYTLEATLGELTSGVVTA